MKKLRVCRGPHCRFRGSERIMEVLEQFFGIKSGQSNTQTDLNYCNCTDNCDWGPNVVEDDTKIYRGAQTKNIAERVTAGQSEPILPLNIKDLKLDELDQL